MPEMFTNLRDFHGILLSDYVLIAHFHLLTETIGFISMRWICGSVDLIKLIEIIKLPHSRPSMYNQLIIQ